MSTGADCQFDEVEPGKWKYRLQLWPYGDNDEYDTFGPFVSFRAAQNHLTNHHANPGGWMVNVHPTDHRHEWKKEEGTYGPIGFEVQIRVESLGPKAEKMDVIRHVLSLPPDHPAFRVFPQHGYIKGEVIQCEACNQLKETADAR